MAKRKIEQDSTHCPCGTGVDYAHCCGPYLSVADVPPHAEQLMRSRYTGYVRCDESYLRSTWHPDTRPSRVRFDPQQHWLGLDIRLTEAGTNSDSWGTVEFVARFKINGKGHRIHEVSRFEKIEGRWYYLDGQHL